MATEQETAHNSSGVGNEVDNQADNLQDNLDASLGDGRHIDPALGSLTGEAAGQLVESARPHPDREAPPVWQQLPSQAPQAGETPTYYDRPVIKEPVWIWTVPLYFFVGGAGGAAAVLGAAAQLLGGDSLRGLVTRCRWLGAFGANLGAVLLIYDLGRPERFYNMLRVFRPTSPMSVGSWILIGAGGVMSVAALLARARGWLRTVGNGAGVLSGLFGVGLIGYTGVLLTNSVVPIWLAAQRSLPILFITSGMASAAALLELMTLTPRETKIVERFGQVGRMAETVAALYFEHDAERVERVGRPLKEGVSGQLWKVSKLLALIGLALGWLPSKVRGQRTVAALCTATGALLLRYAITEAGKASARDPRATFQQQRLEP